MPASEQPAPLDLIFGSWNETTMEFPGDKRVDQLFTEQARRTPDAVALEFEGRRLSYGELEARVEALSRQIERSGVGPGAVIGIYMKRTVEMLVAALGVMRSRNYYLPLDPHYPADRLEYMLEDSGAPLVLTQADIDGVPEAAPRVMVVDASKPVSISERVPAGSDSVQAGPKYDDPLCYVIYTSGSTGKPKGVQISHRAAVNFLWAMKEVFAPRPDDTILAVTTFSFDIAVLELYLPLICGASVALVTEETAQDGAALREKIRDMGANIVQTTPSRWRLIVGAGLSKDDGIEHALCGGEAFPLDLAQDLAPIVGSVWNMYGPTEATVWCSLHRVEPPIAAIPIGRPIGNTQLYILDEDDRLTPVGVPGELYVGGEQLAQGYLNRPELTEERFRWFDDFYGRRVRLYRTGDLCQWRADGAIEYLSRVDQQVKLRGFRIELGEIEASLNRHPAVSNSAVTVRDAGKGDQRLVAFLEASADEKDQLTVGKMRALLGERLPEYMIPSHFAVVEKLPLTPNGKVDRKALPDVELGQLQLQAEGAYVAPRDELERQLAEIWREELRVERVGIRDNFLELGGHSLAMVAIATRIRNQLEKSVPIPVLASTATIEQLSAVIRGDPDEEQPDSQSIQIDELANRRVLRRALVAVIGVMLCAFGLARLYSWPMQAKIIREDPFHTFFSSTEQAHQQLSAERAHHVVMLGSSSGVSDFVPEEFERTFNSRWRPAVTDERRRVRAYNLSLLGATAFVNKVYASELRGRYKDGKKRPTVALVEFSPQNATREMLPNFNEEDTQVGHFISAGTILDAAESSPDQRDRSLERVAYRYLMSPIGPKLITQRVFTKIWNEPSWWPVAPRDEAPRKGEERGLLYLKFVGELRDEIGYGDWHVDARNRVNRRYFQGDWVERRWRQFASRDKVLEATRELAVKDYGVPEMRLIKEAVQQVVSQVKQAQSFSDCAMVVLLPIHPAAKLTVAGRARLRASINVIRTATGAKVIDLYESHDFGQDDFYDVDHLLPGAAKKLSRELARRVALEMNRDQDMLAASQRP